MPTIRHPALRLLAALVVAPCAAVAENYVPNPGFEACSSEVPAQWTKVGAEPVKCDGANPNGGSFSMEVGIAGDQTLSRVQSDCVVVPSGILIPTFRFAYRTASPIVAQVALTAQAYTNGDCTGNNGGMSAGAGASFIAQIVADDAWHTLPNVTGITDAGTHSIRFTASFQTSAVGAASVRFDDLEFASDPAATTTTTSSTSPGTTLEPGATTTTTGVTATTSVTPTTQPVSYPGAGNPSSECFVTFEGIASGKPECTDGDSACDHDGAADGRCTFEVRLCAAQALSGCQAGTITAIKATPASSSIPMPPVPTSAPVCGAPARIAVPLRKGGRKPGKLQLVVSAKNDGKPKRERDVVRFRCLPPA